MHKLLLRLLLLMSQVHNRLDNHHEGLLGGLVTNESLYLALAEDKTPLED